MVTDGPCTVTTDCFFSGNYPLSYNNNEHCSILVQTDVVLWASFFQIERVYDNLRINGVTYRGGEAPVNVSVPAGTVIVWRSDDSIVRQGFEICARPIGNGALPPYCAISVGARSATTLF